MKSKYSQKLSQKPAFLAYSQRFFVFLRRLNNALIFQKIKNLIKVHNCGKFHQYSNCGCQVNPFQSFEYQINIHAVPKYGQILLKFALEVTFQQTKTLFEERLKNMNFFANRTDPKVCTFGPNLKPPFPLKDDRNKKNKYFSEKQIFLRKNFDHWAIQICQNHSTILYSLSRKNTITFAPCGLVLV